MKQIALLCAALLMAALLSSCAAAPLYPENGVGDAGDGLQNGAGDNRGGLQNGAGDNRDAVGDGGGNEVYGNRDGIVDRPPAVADRSARYSAMALPLAAGPKLTLEEAKSIALSHAGLSAAEAGFMRVEMERDEGRLVYKLVFEGGSVRFKYTIDATNGELICYSQQLRRQPNQEQRA